VTRRDPKRENAIQTVQGAGRSGQKVRGTLTESRGETVGRVAEEPLFLDGKNRWKRQITEWAFVQSKLSIFRGEERASKEKKIKEEGGCSHPRLHCLGGGVAGKESA